MEHTLTPWVLLEDADTFQIYKPRKDTIAKIHKRWGDDGKANAAHIVRCVNSHDALVEACEKAERLLTEQLEIVLGVGYDADNTLVNELRAALALAKGE